MTKLFFIISLILTPSISVGQFTTTGATIQDGCNCFDITQETSPNTQGSFYQNATIDLSNNFDLTFTVNFGCDNNSGEGVAFVLQGAPWALGNGGSELGYGGIANSLAVEFDTFDNDAGGGTNLGEIPSDHLSIQANGDIDHTGANNLGTFTPPNISSNYVNVEDCNDHTVQIIWDATLFLLDIIVDGNSSYGGPVNIGDITNTIFGGNSSVQWGWTGSTSVLASTQTVCLALEPEITYTATSCTNQIMNFTGGGISFNPIVSYSWDFDGLGTSNLQNPSFIFVTGGTHPVTLTITDNVGCTSTETFMVEVGFDVNISASPNLVCSNGTSQLEVTALPYNNDCCFDLVLTNFWQGWYGDSIFIYVDGVYYNGYTMYPGATGSTTIETYNLCFNQDANIEIVINGATFPNECTYKLVDAGGNTVIEVLNGAGTWVNGDSQVFTVDCNIIPPIFNYSWDNIPILDNSTISNPIATVATSTTFTVQVTDPITNCTIPQSITINTAPAVTATLSGVTTVCEGSDGNLDVVFTGTPPFDLTYVDPDGNQTTITGINTMTYTLTDNVCGVYGLVTVTGNGCLGTRSGSGTINCVTLPIVDIEANGVYCNGDIINDVNVISINGGTVNWYNDPGLMGPPIFIGNTFSPPSIIGTTTYYAQEVEGVLNCVGPADNVTITINPIPTAPNITGVVEYCDGEVPTPLTAEMSLGGSATWYDSPALDMPSQVSILLQFNPTLTIGTFCYYVTETAAGCTGPDAMICVLTKPTPAPPIITGDITYCEGETPTPLTATPNLGGQINWYNSSNSNIGNSSIYTPDITLGNQTLTATETLDGCTSTDASISITVNILPTIDIPSTINICYSDSTLITATNNGFDIVWSNGDTGESSYLSPETSSMIYATSTNPLCGFEVDSIFVTIFDLPIVTAGNDTVIGIGGEAVLWATGTPSFIWTPAPNVCIETNCSEVYVIPDQATIYVVDGVDANSCHNYDTVLVDISGYMDVFVPNIFSPNADGVNDFLRIDGPRLFNFSIEIYDRWGKLVFKSEEQKDTWNGKFKDQDLAPQTFLYTIRGETVLGQNILLNGNVTIIR